MKGTIRHEPDGSIPIICGLLAKQRCACGAPARFLCDWKMLDAIAPGDTKASAMATCDAPLCAKCVILVDKDKHLCPHHEAAWQRHHLFRSSDTE